MTPSFPSDLAEEEDEYIWSIAPSPSSQLPFTLQPYPVTPQGTQSWQVPLWMQPHPITIQLGPLGQLGNPPACQSTRCPASIPFSNISRPPEEHLSQIQQEPEYEEEHEQEQAE